MGNGFWENGPTRIHRKANPAAAVPLGLSIRDTSAVQLWFRLYIKVRPIVILARDRKPFE